MARILISNFVEAGVTYNLVYIRDDSMLTTWLVQLIKGDYAGLNPNVIWGSVLDETVIDTQVAKDDAAAIDKVTVSIITPLNAFLANYFAATPVLSWIDRLQAKLVSLIFFRNAVDIPQIKIS